LPIERNLTRSPVVETRPTNSVVSLPTLIADAKEFSSDPTESPTSVSCGGGKCAGPCVQRCLPLPPPPGRCKQV